MFTPRSSFSSRTPFSNSKPLPPQNLPLVIHLPLINTKKTPVQIEMTDLLTHFSFFDFLDYHNKKINVIEKILSWTKTKNHEKVYQTYPPFESIILNQNSGVQVLATPIKRPSLRDDNKNLDSIIQNNYTNTYLKTIGQKLQDIEDRITLPSTSIKKRMCLISLCLSLMKYLLTLEHL